MENSSYQSDLAQTVQELSNTYEELSLLYRVSGMFSTLSSAEIYSRMVDEAVDTIGVKTAAVLLWDEKNDVLVTRTSTGDWNGSKIFSRDGSIFWKVMESRKPSAFCRIAETEHCNLIPDIKSLMVCPIVGKLKTIGVIAVADKAGDQEFYAHDLKLLLAISSQAGLSIENALLYTELEGLLVGAIRSLVKALEATSYWTAGHTERVTEYSIAIGRVLGLDAETLEKLKICSLLHDIGKIATPKEILNKDCQLNDREWAEIRKHPEIGAEILGEMKQFNEIILGIKYHHEHYDGRNSLFGLKSDEIPLLARILSVADAFDALTSDRPYRPRRPNDEAVQEISRCSGTQFDPHVVDAFLQWVNGTNQQRRAPAP